MKKRILSLILAVMLLGSPMAFAEETGVEPAGAAAPVEAAAPVAEAVITEVPAAVTSTAAGENTLAGETAAPASDSTTVGETTTPDSGEISAKETSSEETTAQVTESKEEDSATSEETETAEKESSSAGTEESSNGTSGSLDFSGWTAQSTTTTVSGQTITIKDITLATMPTNSDYLYLSFTFGPENGTQYEGYLAGLKIAGATSYVEEDGQVTNTENVAVNSLSTDQKILNLVTDITESFYSNSTIKLSDSQGFADKYGLTISPVDTEKEYTSEASYRQAGYPYDTDTDLCWAASASDMIEFTGWNDQVDSTLGLTDEDKIFDYFMHSYTDEGSKQFNGIKWFFNGVHIQESVATGTASDVGVGPALNAAAGKTLMYFTKTDNNDTYSYCYSLGTDANSDLTKSVVYYCKTVKGTESGTSNTVYYDSENNTLFSYDTEEKTGVYEGQSISYTKKTYYNTDSSILFYSITVYGDTVYYDKDGTTKIPSPGIEYDISDTSSQEKFVYNTGTKDGNLFSDYAAESAATYYTAANNGYDPLYDSIMGLKDGVSTGVGIYFFDEEKNQVGGHAVTVLGYLRDTLKKGWESLSALFLSDSDNDMDNNTTRAQAVDSVTMYETAVTPGKDINKRPVTAQLTLPNYLGEGYEKYKTSLLTYSTLLPYSSTIDTETDSHATKNAVTTVDYVVNSVEVDNSSDKAITSSTVGDEVWFWTNIKNWSYQGLDMAQKPYCQVTYTIQCDGQIIDTVTDYINISKGDGEPLSGTWLDTSYTPTKTGNYTVTVTLNGIYYDDANGNRVLIPEAYYLNNICKQIYSFTVNARPIIPTPEYQGGTEKRVLKPDKSTIPTYETTFSINNPSSCILVLQDLKDEISTITFDGETLNEGDYTVTYAEDGTASIQFSDEFIQSLLPGEYSFRLHDASGKVIACVDISVS